jgi:hypothetical protein
LFPYNEVAQWCFKKFDPSTATIINKSGRKITSLRPEDVSARYHLPGPACSLNELFLKGFSQSNKGPTKLMKNWWVDEDRPFKQGQKLIPTHEFKAPYKMLIAMLNRLYGEEKSTHFQMDWLPMAHTIVKTDKCSIGKRY